MMSGNKKKKQCPYNEWVYCSDETCDYCGWNPDGRKKVKMKKQDTTQKKDFVQRENGSGRKTQKNNKSGYAGVYWDNLRQKWKASIYKEGKRHHLGCFDTFDEAVSARRKAEEQKKQNAK